MKKLILFLSLLLATAVVSAQSELPSDDRTPRAPEENYKEFGGFLLDMGLMSVMPPHLPKVDLSLSDTGKDFNQLFRLNPDVTYSQGLSNVFTPSFSGFGGFGFGSAQNLQMGSFKLKNGMRINILIRIPFFSLNDPICRFCAEPKPNPPNPEKEGVKTFDNPCE